MMTSVLEVSKAARKDYVQLLACPANTLHDKKSASHDWLILPNLLHRQWKYLYESINTSTDGHKVWIPI